MLSEKYRLESVLGRGGMGSVWRAEHLGLRAPVAVKLMDPSLALTPDALARFHREAHAAASIRSPHVVQVLDHGLDERSNTPFIVMELLDGETLGERLGREGTLSAAKTAELVADVCRALTRAHEAGIVHRDLKPENIFLVKDDREFAKVLDFGVAKSQPFALGVSGGSSSGSLVGTPCYMSPEHINGSKDLDGRSDLWSVAVIACECITGHCPFDADTLGNLLLAICTRPAPLASTLGRVTPAFDAWLARALEPDPSRRFQTARELSDALRGACAGEEPSSHADGPGDTLVLFGQRRGVPRSIADSAAADSAAADSGAADSGAAERPGPDASAVDAVTTRGGRRSTGKLVAASGAFMLLLGVGAWVFFGEPAVEASSGAAIPEPAVGIALTPAASAVEVNLTTAPPGEAAPPLELPANGSTRPAASVPLDAPSPARKRPLRKPVIRRPSSAASLQSALEGARGRERK